VTDSPHRVASHLGVEAETYDVAIRQFVPHYDEMIGVVIDLVDSTLPDDGLVIDLGAGTGALAHAVLEAIPRARVQLVDIDPAMLGVAGTRVGKHGTRAELRCASFFDPLPRCGAVIASLSLHHVHELGDKRALFAAIRDALVPGGVFVVADVTVHAAGPERDRTFREWVAAMAAAGIAEPDAHALFAKWAEGPTGDRYHPLETEISLLREAGFTHPDCFWKRGPSTVYGGFA
jgi:tRNA (cmo5U34)-methyltransferase